MKRHGSVFCCIILLLIAMLLCPSCKETEGDFQLYFRDAKSYRLYQVSASFDKNANLNSEIFAVYEKLKNAGSSSRYVSPFPEGLIMKNATVSDGRMVISFNQAYYGYTVTEQTLLRAALVKTYTQFPEISAQTANDYIDLFADGLNESTPTEMTLYFATEEGKLKKTVRTVDVKPSAQTERVVMSLLLQGPMNAEEGIQTVPEGVQLISVSTVNGCCYVNLTDSVLKANPTVMPELMIYAIVDSLTEIRDISSVQFLVNSSSNASFQDTIDFSQPFSRNLDFLTDGGALPQP